MTDAPALEAQEVSKTYEGASTSALSDVNLHVQPGEFYSFLGPSGCGKTTMLRIFAGFETATTGKVFVGGKLMNGVPPNKRPVNMVFQSYALFPHLSVLDNVAFGLRAKGKVPPAEIITQSKEALSIVRLTNLADRLPAQLSGGQQQRVALARALVMRPVVLLLDEPLSALDVQIREEMQEELSRLQKQLNISFVMVTHDQSEALALSSCVSVFNNGRIEQVGTPKEIYDAPRTAFVAKFIGRSNVLTGKVLESSPRAVLVGLPEGQKVACSLAAGKTAPGAGEEISFCLKPEVISPVMARQAATAGAGSENWSEGGAYKNTLSCRLESSSYQGSLADLRLAVAGLPQALRATVSASIIAAISEGGELALHFAASDVHILEGEAAAAVPATTGESAHVAVS